MPATGERAGGVRVVRAGWLVLPALVPTVVVLVTGIGSAIAASLGLDPLVGGARLSLDAYRMATANGALGDGLRVTLAVAAISTLLAVLIGFATAVLVQNSLRGGRALAVLATATVPIPHLVGAATVGLLLSDSGLLARVAGAAPGTWPPLVAGPTWAAVIAEYSWKESAFVAVVVLAVLVRDGRGLDEAAAVLGARGRQRVLRVSLPLAAPALIVSGTIAFAYTVGSYEVPWLLGSSYPEPLPVLAFRLFGDTDLAARPSAMAVSVVTVAVAAAALGVGSFILSRVAGRR